MTYAQERVLALLDWKPMGATALIAALDGDVYPHGHPTLWRRVDRAIQQLRKAGIIKNVEGKWDRV